MKKTEILLLGIITIFLTACSGSDTYRGAWKAMSTGGEKYSITFDAKNFSIEDSTRLVKKYQYTQNSVEIKNSIKTYGIRLNNGRNYQIHFPMSNNDSIALIRDDNGNPVYTIGRQNFVSYEDIYKLK